MSGQHQTATTWERVVCSPAHSDLTSPPCVWQLLPKLPPLQLMGYCPLTHIAAWLLQLLSLPHIRPRAAAPRMLLLLLWRLHGSCCLPAQRLSLQIICLRAAAPQMLLRLPLRLLLLLLHYH